MKEILTTVPNNCEMDEKGNLHEALAIVEPTEKVNWTPLQKLESSLSILLLSFMFTLIILSADVTFTFNDQVGHRLIVMIKPFGILILGAVNQLNNDFGNHALEIVGLCSIVILMALTRAGCVTRRGVSMAVCTFLSLVAIFVFAGVVCEVYLVLDSGQSKLRDQMREKLCLAAALPCLLCTLRSVQLSDEYYKKEQAEGRPVPWFFPAIICRITKVMAFILILMNNMLSVQTSFYGVMGMVTLIPGTFIDGFTPYCIKHEYVVFGITCAILIAIIASIVASAGPSYTDLEAIMNRDLFKYAVCNAFFFFACIASLQIGFVVIQTTKCPAVYMPTVHKSTLLCVFITILCICKYFKVTPTNLSDFVGRPFALMDARLRHTPPPAPPLPPAETELDTLLTDADCDTKSSNQGDKQLNDITAHKKSWGLAGCTATATVTAITGITRDNASYTLLSDTESGEIFIRSSERRTQCI